MHFPPTLRYYLKNNARHITYMSVLIFYKCLDSRKMLILGQPPSYEFISPLHSQHLPRHHLYHPSWTPETENLRLLHHQDFLWQPEHT